MNLHIVNDSLVFIIVYNMDVFINVCILFIYVLVVYCV